MHRRTISRAASVIGLLLAVAWLLLAVGRAAAEESPALIPEAEIGALEKDLVEGWTKSRSLVERRRACKTVARAGTALVEADPAAPNRFRVLGVVLESRKRLLSIENIDRNRRALFAVCGALLEAPDEYAEVRFEAEMLLSDRDLSARDATVAERVAALEEMIARYRDTAAEAKSLMIGVLIARKLDARQLEREILDTMDERFSDDTEVITFRREKLSRRSLGVKCTGVYERADGTRLFLPADRIGHHCLMVFWSKMTPGIEEYLGQVEEQRARYPDMFDVYSFNVDELPDAGETVLRGLKLDWTAMRLPGGRRHEAYRAYALGDPVTLMVNAYGYTILKPGAIRSDATVGMRGERTGVFKISDERVSHDRYLAQLQSLFIGDFLVIDSPGPFDPASPPELRMLSLVPGAAPVGTLTRTAASVPAETLRAIQDCFTAPPLRYRLTRTEARAGYERAEALCAEAIGTHPDAPDLWIVRNRRIIALLGLWNISCEPRFLAQAAGEAKAALAGDLPRGADVVARFGLAKAALRAEKPDPVRVLPAMIEASGGDEAPASVLAAAAILAVDANSRELYDGYRRALLEAPGDGSPALWPLLSFLRNRYHQFHLLTPNFVRHEGRWTRGYIVNHGGEPMIDPFPTAELRALDGKPLTLPDEGTDRLTLLVFLEPPPDGDFPVVLDRNGKPTRNDHVRGVMRYASDLTGSHVNNGVRMIAAFLCDDTDRVGALMQANDWTCEAAIVPGGVTNPIVRRLGILSADRVPNVFLIRRDGTIAWSASGLKYKTEFGYPFAFLLAMKVHIETCEVEYAYGALERGDFAAAARLFAGPFLPARPDRYGWRSPRHHGRALADMGLHDWDAALGAIDMAIDAHKLRHFRGRRSKNIADWRKDAATVTIKEPCDILAELWTTKAVILEKLGRDEEAAELRGRAAGPIKPDGESPYTRFHAKLKRYRLDHYDQREEDGDRG